MGIKFIVELFETQAKADDVIPLFKEAGSEGGYQLGPKGESTLFYFGTKEQADAFSKALADKNIHASARPVEAFIPFRKYDGLIPGHYFGEEQ